MGAKYEIEGRLHHVSPVINVKETFKKREILLVQENGQYPNYVKLQATQDKTVMFDHAQPGDLVKISFYINGRLGTDKEGRETVWNNLNVQEVAYLQKQPMPAPTTGQYHAPAAKDDFDDVPF